MVEELTQISFAQLLLSGTFVHVAPFEVLQEKYGVNIQPNVVVLVSMDRYPDLADGKPVEWKIIVGRKLVEQLDILLPIPFLWAWTEEGVLALLLDFHEVPAHDRKREILLLAEEIQKGSDQIGIHVSIGIGNFYDDPVSLICSFEEAKKSMSGRFFQGNKLIFHTDMRKNIVESLKIPLTKEKSELFSIVRIGHTEGVVTGIKGIMDRVAEIYNYNEEVFKSEVIDLLMMMSRIVLEAGVSPVSILTNTANVIQDLYHTIRYDKFVMKVCKYAEWLTEQVENIYIRDVSPNIKQAIRYMKENHQKEVSLEEIAHYCHLSRYHFSHLFKKEVGTSVMDFFNKLRIDKSLFYLEKTDLSVQEIANQVGFEDSNYFSRLFKKYIHSSPTEYRRLMSNRF
ncbi:AraC family transcriptional regulator [Bacillus salipaludis]|uniref:AraC family transcriptional regulator n=1 Tax=Bacillus salipaludis TaxID=2547811 RepID=A0A4R5VYZ1_9BACI|nr:helix-turn-helix domain-containing protein [Bacillus salipaludis]TDK64276.1 AraC family transcriptional regulator [Bacillus salipaludis]